MAKETNSALQQAANDFAELVGSPIKSNLLSETIALEGEYKDDLSPEDDLDIPEFLRGPDPKNPFKRKPTEQASEKPVSERVFDRVSCLAVLNEIQDRGYIRSETKQVDEKTRRYTYVHPDGTVSIRIKQVDEGYRIVGADTILSTKTR